MIRLPFFIICAAGLAAFANVPSLQARVFQDRFGHRIEAEIVDASETTVTLKTGSNSGFDVSFANFSPADQTFIKDWIARKSSPEKAPSAAQPDSLVQIDFPDLPPDRHGKPAACRVRLPLGYDPVRPMPLLVWFGGGDGTNSPDEALELVDRNQFAVAAMPYPTSVPAPKDALAAGKMDEIWKYHAVMLKKLIEAFPSIDPKIRIAGGFSNGAHTVGCNISDGQKEFISFFRAFVIIEGGTPSYGVKRPLHNCYAFLAWGEGEGGSKGYMTGMVSAAKAARLKTTTYPMKGVGHAFPAPARQEVKKWIEETVIPALAKSGS